MTSTIRRAAVLALATALLSAGAALSPAPAGAALPDYALINIPASANRFDAPPSRTHPTPVILVHGTWVSAQRLAPLATRLADSGFDVFAFNYGLDDASVAGDIGSYATGPIIESVRQLADFVDLVRSRTGADQVDIVGHSQGGLVARRYLHESGGEAVRSLVTLGSPHHGTTMHGLADLVGEGTPSARATADIRTASRQLLGAAGTDMMRGSRFLAETNRVPDPSDVAITAIVTRYDEAVTPAESGLLAPAPNVRNIVVQNRFPSNIVEHTGLPHDRDVQNLIIGALA